jgi:hypothetical protein
VNAALRWAFVLLVAAHGIAHLPGFAVSWRLLASPDVPYHTALLHGRWPIGDTGIRVVGLLWLLAALAFVAGAALLAARWPYAAVLIAGTAGVSLLLCVAELPYARVGLGGNVALLVLLPLAALAFWRDDTARLIASVSHGASAEAGAGASLEGVPPVVGRYLHRAMAGGRVASAVHLEQEAEFWLEGWRPLRASQFMQASPPAFVWDARIAMAPGVAVHVRDGYGRTHGSMRAAAMGILPLATQQARPELDAGSLHRYLAELVWMPSALRPSLTLHWEPLSDRAARATVVDGANTVALEFTFNDEGDVEEIYTPARYAEKDGHYTPQAWQVRCSEHRTFDGFRVPAYCEVAWMTPAGRVPYWRGRITAARYTVARGAPAVAAPIQDVEAAR